MSRLYVGNLPWRIREQELELLFQKVGPVSDVVVILDKETGKSKGFGFVEMDSDDDVQTAIDQLHESDLDGRKIVVANAHQRQTKTA